MWPETNLYFKAQPSLCFLTFYNATEAQDGLRFCLTEADSSSSASGFINSALTIPPLKPYCNFPPTEDFLKISSATAALMTKLPDSNIEWMYSLSHREIEWNYEVDLLTRQGTTFHSFWATTLPIPLCTMKQKDSPVVHVDTKRLQLQKNFDVRRRLATDSSPMITGKICIIRMCIV